MQPRQFFAALSVLVLVELNASPFWSTRSSGSSGQKVSHSKCFCAKWLYVSCKSRHHVVVIPTGTRCSPSEFRSESNYLFFKHSEPAYLSWEMPGSAVMFSGYLNLWTRNSCSAWTASLVAPLDSCLASLVAPRSLLSCFRCIFRTRHFGSSSSAPPPPSSG